MFSGRTQYRPFSWGLSSSNTSGNTGGGGSRPTSAAARDGGTTTSNNTSTSGGGLLASGSKYSSSTATPTSHQPSSSSATTNNAHQPVPPSTTTTPGGNNIKTTTNSAGINSSHVQQYRVGGGATSASHSTNATPETSGTYHPSGSAINVLRTNSGNIPSTSATATNPQQPSSTSVSANSNRYGFHPSASHNNNNNNASGGSAAGGTSSKGSGGGGSSTSAFIASTSLLPSNPQIRSVNIINPSGMSRDQHTRLQQMLLAVGSATPADGTTGNASSSAASTTSAAGRGFRAGGSRTLSPSAVAGGKDGAISSLLLPSAIPALIEASAAAESQWARGITSVPESHHDANGEDDQLNNTANSVVTLTGSQSGHSTPRGDRENSQGGGPRQPPSCVKSAVYELQSRLRSVELFHLWMVAPETQRDLAALVSDQRAKMNKTLSNKTAALHVTPEPPLSKLWAPTPTTSFSTREDDDGGMVKTDATAAEERASSSSPTVGSLATNTRLPTPSLAVDKGALSPVGSPLSPSIHEDKPALRASGGLMSTGTGEEPTSPFVPPIKPTVSSSSPQKGGGGAAADISGGVPLMRTTSAEGLEGDPRESPARRRPGGPEVPMSPHTPSEARKGSPLPIGPNHSFRRSPHHLKSNEFSPGSMIGSASLSPRHHLQVDEMDALHAKGRISPRREAPPPEHQQSIIKATASAKATVGVAVGTNSGKNLEFSESFKLDDDDTFHKSNNNLNSNKKVAGASNLDASFKLDDNNSKANDNDSDVSSVATADDDPGAAKNNNNKKTKRKSSGEVKPILGTTTPAQSVPTTPAKAVLVELPVLKQATIKDIPPFYFPRGKPVNKNGVGASNSSVRSASSVVSKTATAAPALLVLRGATFGGHEDPHLRPFAGLALPMGQQLQADQLPGHEGLSNAQLSPTRQQRKKSGGGSISPGGTATGSGGAGGGNDVVEDVQLFTEDGTPIPGYKLAPLAILKGYVDSEHLAPALTKLFASLPVVPTPPPPAPAGALSSSSMRAPSAQGSRLGSRAGGAGATGVSRLGGTRPGTAANLRATEQQNYLKAEAAYRQALYATMCKVCTDYLGLPKYFAVPVMKLLLSTASSSSTSPAATSSPPLQASGAVAPPSQVQVKEGIPIGTITAASVKEFFDTWLSGKDIIRRMFDTLIACSSVSHLIPNPSLSSADEAPSANSNTPTAAVTRNYLVKEDFLVYFQSLLDHHPGLAFLHQTVDFQQKYLETIAVRIFYSLDVRDTKRISWREFEMSKLPDAIRQVDHTDDINTVLNFFSYEHFYVVYCRFWELDKNQEMKLTRADLARYFPEGAANPLVIDRVFSGKGRKLAGTLTHQQASKMSGGGAVRGGRGAIGRGAAVGRGGGVAGRGGRGGGVGNGAQEVPMTYEDFVWFCLAEEDKASPRSIRYWFNILDLDGDGLISGFELESFYQSTRMSMMSITTEAISFEDIMCQITDMVPALAQNYKEYRGPSPSNFKSILAASSSGNNKASAAASPTISSRDVLGGWIRRTASTGRRSLMSLDGSAASRKRGSVSNKPVPKSSAPPQQPPVVASVRKYLEDRSKWETMQREKFDSDNNSISSVSLGGGGGTVDPLARYHKYGLTLSDLLRNPTNAYVALNMVLNAIKFLQFEQRDPYVLHQDRLMGGFEGNEWDRFARAEYDRMAAEAE